MTKAILYFIIVCAVIYIIHKLFGDDDMDDMDYSAY